MKTDEFNRGCEIDRKWKGVKAIPKLAAGEPVTFQTADGTNYDPLETYYFFDAQSREVRQSPGLRHDGTHLCTFGLRVIPVDKPRLYKMTHSPTGRMASVWKSSDCKSESPITNLRNRAKSAV